MMASRVRSLPIVALATGALAMLGFGVLPHAGSGETLVVWTIGSPYRGDAPPARVPPTLQRTAARRGLRIIVLLAAARDPVTNTAFLKDIRSMMAVPTSAAERGGNLPHPARLVSPSDGRFPRPRRGQRFGTFTWQSSASPEVIAEIVEFAYEDDARLIVGRPTRPGSAGHVSAGQLWTTRGEWRWRIWSISRAGDMAFSDVRSFTH